MSVVGIKRCDTYLKKNIDEAFEELTEGFEIEKINNKNILIFFDFPFPNEKIIKKTIDFLKKNGAKSITAGTSLFVNGIDVSIKKLLTKEKVNFIDFRKDNYEEINMPLRKIPHADHFRGFGMLSPVQFTTEKKMEKIKTGGIRTLNNVFLPASLSDNDYIVAITKMKDSPLLKLGGFISSMMYLITTKTRSEIFVNAMRNKHHESLLEIFSLIKDRVLFGVVDGIKGYLSDREEVNDMNVLLFSEDLLSLDSVSSVLLGFRSSDIETNKLGDMMDFGKGALNHIALYGDDFVKIRKESVKFLKYSRIFNKKSFPFPRIEQGDYSRINKVADLCPTGAIQEQNGLYTVNRNICIKCYFCVEIANETFKV